MNHTRSLEQIRAVVARAFAECELDADEFSEIILIRNGHYCGRRFTVAGGSAVWFLEENQIKVYDAQGTLLAVRATVSEVAERRAA